MSGIAVLFHRDRRPAEPRALGEMLEAMHHRGQDGLNGRLFGDVALGHASTVVLPEDEGVIQPIVSPRTGCAIVADVRLDNRDELLAHLRDCPPGVSDAEIILRAYERWALDTPKRLLGDFAFAIWDPKNDRIVCARDVAAQRTLYYRLDDRTFAAATEIQALFQDPTVPIEPNEDRIIDSLVPYNLMSNTRDRADTYFVGIHCLQAAHLLVVERRDSTITRYWRLDPSALPRVRDEESDEQFRAVFFEAVRARLRTSRKIGVFLSGGLDSTSVACTAQTLIQQGRASVPGFVGISATYPGLDCDERPFVEATRDMYGFETHFVETDPRVESLDALLTGFRESPQLPTGGTASLVEAATRHSMSVVMTGEVADALMIGSSYMLDHQLRRGDLPAYWRNLLYCRSLGYGILRLLVVHSFSPLLPITTVRKLAEFDVRRDHRKISWKFTPTWLPTDLRSELLNRDLEYRVTEQRRRVFRSIGQHVEHSRIDPPEAPFVPTGSSLEVWRPFADRRLTDFLLAVAPHQKIRLDAENAYAGSKQFARRALRDILPHQVRSRSTKAIFNGTIAACVAREWATIEWLFESTQPAEIVQRGIIDPSAMHLQLQMLRNGDLSGDLLWVQRLVGIELWLRSIRHSRDEAVKVTAGSGQMSHHTLPSEGLDDEACVPI